MLHYIVNDYDTITLGHIAEKLNYSVPYCSKYIKEVTGCSFVQLLKKIRFQKDRNLLTTNYSVHKISELIGYENPENFIRAFTRMWNIPQSVQAEIG